MPLDVTPVNSQLLIRKKQQSNGGNFDANTVQFKLMGFLETQTVMVMPAQLATKIEFVNPEFAPKVNILFL